MQTRRPLCFYITLVSVIVLTNSYSIQTQECPPCTKDQEPMSGGCCDTCPDGSGRRIIKEHGFIHQQV